MRLTPAPTLRSLPACAVFLFTFGWLTAAEPVGPTVELPEVVVKDSRELPPPEQWRYAEIPGFEILTNASDRSTQRLLKDFQMFNMALSVVWPALQPRNAMPISLILCGRGGKFDTFVPVAATKVAPDQGVASLLLHDSERTAIVLDMQATVLNIESSDISATTTGVASSGVEVDPYRQLYREYVRYLLSRTEPRLPVWLEEGLAQLLMGMKFDQKHISFAKLEDPNEVSSEQADAAAATASESDDSSGAAAPATAPSQDRGFQASLARAHLMSLPEMFAVERDSPTALNPVGSRWAKQCYAFVHMCLYGENQRYQKGFLQFVIRLTREPLSEAMFKECFGESSNSMAIALRGYIGMASYKSIEWKARKGSAGFEDPPPLALRDATEAESGRIKGDAQVIAGRLDEARLSLGVPYARGERDPRLLASLGLWARVAKDEARARKFLEMAAAAKVVRPRVYTELATMNYAAASAKPAGVAQKLSADQVGDIMKLLLTARSQLPPMPETYELMATTWLASETAPTPAHLAVLEEGVRVFPRRIDLICQTAQLEQQNGQAPKAGAIIDMALRVNSRDAATKTRLEQLKATLPPAPVSSPTSG